MCHRRSWLYIKDFELEQSPWLPQGPWILVLHKWIGWEEHNVTQLRAVSSIMVNKTQLDLANIRSKALDLREGISCEL